MEARSCRNSFSEEEKFELKKAYEHGLDSTRKEKAGEIERLAVKLGRNTQEIKYWIGNERRRRKTLDGGEHKQPLKKAPQKLRAPNSYNLFVKDFFKSSEGQAIIDLGDKNKAAAMKWKEMDEEGKTHYQQLATQLPSPSASSHDKWHETQRILTNMQDSSDWAEKNGLHVYYVVCNDKNHYVGGTSSGRHFLQANAHVPASFLISTKPALAVGNPHSKVPYSKLKSTNIIGLPASTHLRHPSTMPQDQQSSSIVVWPQ